MKRKLTIKVCGMMHTANRQEIDKLPVDLLGFIFYSQSKRFVGAEYEPGLFNTTKKKTGVFVDENIFEMMGLAKNLGFEYIQLHGKENPDTCKILKKQGLKVIKAFNLHDAFDFSVLLPYEKNVSYFLFDTRSELPGGSGKKFNWKVLEKYTGHTPFFLSGGIQPEDADAILQLDHPKLHGIDLNSGFEDEPGLKNIEKLKSFISAIKGQ
jgi:phosphoribosylanthranilate isomerase